MEQTLLTAAVVVYIGIDMIVAALRFYLNSFVKSIRFISLTGKERRILDKYLIYSLIDISIFNCVGFSYAGFSNVGFSNVGKSNIGESVF